LEKAGNQQASKITRGHIVEGRDRRKATPTQARHFIDTMRSVFEWAAEAQLIKADPTAGVKYPKQPKTDGFTAWTEDHVAAYESRWPIGTRERVWLGVAAGVPGSAHGLRKLAAIRLALAGATIPQLNAIFGWTGSEMAMYYIDMADRAQLARDGMQKLRAERPVNKSAPYSRGSKGQNG